MLVDYKFHYIKRDSKGFITEVAVKFYEGELVDQDKNLVYIRIRRLQKPDLPIFSDKLFIKDLSGTDCRLYTSADFGTIETDDQLRLFLKSELLKNPLWVGTIEQVGEVLK